MANILSESETGKLESILKRLKKYRTMQHALLGHMLKNTSETPRLVSLNNDMLFLLRELMSMTDASTVPKEVEQLLHQYREIKIKATKHYDDFYVLDDLEESATESGFKGLSEDMQDDLEILGGLSEAEIQFLCRKPETESPNSLDILYINVQNYFLRATDFAGRLESKLRDNRHIKKMANFAGISTREMSHKLRVFCADMQLKGKVIEAVHAYNALESLSYLQEEGSSLDTEEAIFEALKAYEALMAFEKLSSDLEFGKMDKYLRDNEKAFEFLKPFFGSKLSGRPKLSERSRVGDAINVWKEVIVDKYIKPNLSKISKSDLSKIIPKLALGYDVTKQLFEQVGLDSSSVSSFYIKERLLQGEITPLPEHTKSVVDDIFSELQIIVDCLQEPPIDKVGIMATLITSIKTMEQNSELLTQLSITDLKEQIIQYDGIFGLLQNTDDIESKNVSELCDLLIESFSELLKPQVKFFLPTDYKNLCDALPSVEGLDDKRLFDKIGLNHQKFKPHLAQREKSELLYRRINDLESLVKTLQSAPKESAELSNVAKQQQMKSALQGERIGEAAPSPTVRK